MRIAVVGAGIGGLAAAALLADLGHDISLFDRFETPLALGSGLILQPVGLAVLARIGLAEEARSIAAPIRAMLGHAARGRVALDVSYPAGHPGLGMHRGALFGLLWQGVQARQRKGTIALHTGAPVLAAPLQGPLRLIETAAASFGPFDLVADASGAGSALSPLRARPLGFGAIWGEVPWPAATALPPDRLTQRYAAAHRMAGVLPIGRLPPGFDGGSPAPRAAIFWSLRADALAAWPEVDFDLWRDEAIRFWPDFAPFLAPLAGAHAMTPARYSHGHLARPIAPAMAHLGDAAHRASPQLGQGANMALLDALALSLALGPAFGSGDPLDRQLAQFVRLRRRHIRLYQAASALLTPFYQSDSRVLPLLRDHLLARASGSALIRPLLTRLVTGDLIAPLTGRSLA